MKKGLFLCVFLVLVLLGGCRKTLVVHVPVSPGMSKEATLKAEKEATRQAVAEKKTEEAAAKAVREIARRARQQAEWKQGFSLYCPLGGYERVVIEPHLGDQLTYWRGGGRYKFAFRRPVFVHRMHNPYDQVSPRILEGGILAVSNMCPGGSLTLVSSMNRFVDGNIKRVVWNAEGHLEGRLARDESSPGILWDGQTLFEPTRINEWTWELNFKKTNKVF